jgi:hypothetical protein
MSRNALSVDALIAAMLQLDPATGERQNVIAFARSCFGGRVLYYDLDRAEASLARLSGEEQHALIEWALRSDR